MILHVVGFALRILLSASFSHATELKAVVGQLFQFNVSMLNGYRNDNLPEWICKSPSKYQGIPTMNHVTTRMVNENLSISVKSEPPNHHCIHRWPTVMMLLTDKDLSKMSGCERVKLWNLLQLYLPSYVEDMKFEENIDKLMKSLSVFMNWNPDMNNKRYKIHSAIIFHIGCGSIPEIMINNLKYLEKLDNVNKLSTMLSISIREWLVADQLDPIIVRKRRHSKNNFLRFPEYSSVFYRHENQQRKDWNEARNIIEGSGIFQEDWSQSNNNVAVGFQTNKTVFNPNEPKNNFSKLKVSQKNTTPFIKKSLENMTVIVGSKKYFEIPAGTFFDVEDGDSRQLKLKIYLRSIDSIIDRQIYLNTNQWIYFLQDQQVVVVQPGKKDVGQYDLTVCAYDSDMNRICDDIKVFIKKPPSLRKSSHFIAQTGIIWKYQLQADWLDEIKHKFNDSITVRVQSSSLILWQPKISTINLITEAYTSQEHSIKMIAESEMTGKTLIWEIIVTVSGHNVYTDATSAEIVFKFTLLTLERVPFEFINMLKEKLIETISRYWKILSLGSQDILLYRIINGREAFVKSPKDFKITLSFIYSPKKSHVNPSTSANCSEVAITQELLSNFKLTNYKSPQKWIMEMINLIVIPGKCLHNEITFKDIGKMSTTPRNSLPDSYDPSIPSDLNKTIKLDVKNGLTFKKIIVFPFQPMFNNIRSMELLDQNNLIIYESSWVFLSSTEFAIYGLPLLENVRRQPYIFKLKVTWKSGKVQMVILSIVVEKFVSKFNHKFDLIISISEKDTLELSRTVMQLSGNPLKTMGQLLVSQTFSYRWLAIQTLASYLYSDKCNQDCGTNIFIYSFSEPKSWQINISWSMMYDSVYPPEYPTINSVASCSDAKLKSYIRSLMISDQITESIISMFSSSIWTFKSKPHKKLLKAFQSKYLGTPNWVNVESSGPCSSSLEKHETDSGEIVLWSNITVFQGSIFAFPLDRKKITKSKPSQELSISKIFFLNGSVCQLEWLRLSNNGGIIYGLPLLSDVVIQSYFSLRILLELPESRNKVNYYLSMSLRHGRHLKRNSHRVNMTIMVKQTNAEYFRDLEYRIRIARVLNGYLHPSCTLGNYTTVYKGFQLFTQKPYKHKYVRFCENAEDTILHYINHRTDGERTVVDLVWSQMSVSSNDSCDIARLQDLSRNLFQNYTSNKPNKEMVSFFSNLKIGEIIHVDLFLFGQCFDTASKTKIPIPFVLKPNDMSYIIYPVPSQSSTKIVLGVLCFLTILTISICMTIYFIKKGLPSSFPRFNDNSSKSVAMEDFTSKTKSPLKSKLPSFTKRPKNIPALESFGSSYSKNSPKTPLLSQFSREDSRTDKQKEPVFNDEATTGSYSYAVCHPQSPEPEMSSNNNFTAIPKQPATNNVIRNPAMMMGSRLNPYRNIPPPII